MPLSSLARTQLSLRISQLLLAVPIRSRATFVELLCACLVSPEGWVNRAISAICRRKHWTTYYKLIERGSVRIVPVARATFSLVLAVLTPDAIVLVIDDTLVPRGSLSAPGCDLRFDHARKINQPEYLRSQNWVTLGISIFTAEGRRWVLPVLSRLVPATGNRNKFPIALALVRALAPVADILIRVLFDSRFMRAHLVLPLLHRGLHRRPGSVPWRRTPWVCFGPVPVVHCGDGPIGFFIQFSGYAHSCSALPQWSEPPGLHG